MESIETVLADLLSKKDDEIGILQPFLAKQTFARSDVSRLKSVTQAYDSLIDVEDQLVATHNKWMKLMGKESKEIGSSAQYKPEVFDVILNSLGVVIDSVKPKLKEISEAFPEHETVQSILKDYIRSKDDLNNSFKAKSKELNTPKVSYQK